MSGGQMRQFHGMGSLVIRSRLEHERLGFSSSFCRHLPLEQITHSLSVLPFPSVDEENSTTFS